MKVGAKHKRFTAVQAFRAVLDQLKRKENQAIRSGKWPMWAYNRAMVDLLVAVYRSAEDYPSDGGNPNLPVLRAFRKVVESSDYREGLVRRGYCYNTDFHSPWTVALAAALRVYAADILRLVGEVVPRGNVSWLRAQKRWEDDAITDDT